MEGEIVGTLNGFTVKVDVPSKTKSDPVTRVSQRRSFEGNHFQVVAWFDTTSNVIAKETRDRDPAFVIVKLMNGRRVLDQKTLSIETDFRLTKEDDYQPMTQVVLNAPTSK